jgi:hypothetical protein
MQGLSAPNTKKIAELQRPEHGNGDHFGYGTLTFTLDTAASPYPASHIAPVPTGLVATAGVSQVTLNWAIATGATTQGFNVLRSTTSGGPYTSIASWTAKNLQRIRKIRKFSFLPILMAHLNISIRYRGIANL